MKQILKLNPFGKFCCTIGNLPTSYMESLTYEEQLLWFCNFLEKTVIPTVNNNAEAVTELQGLFTELQNYVNHYFDNLDVQEEINKKLDQMAQSGALSNILEHLLDPFKEQINNDINRIENLVNSTVSGSPIPVSNISEMTDTNRIYVLTTTGHWYYYNTQWTDGGIYQATGIADNSISVYNFDDLLSSNFIKEYDNLEYEANLQGFGKVVNNKISIDTDPSWVHAVINLENNQYYEFSGYNFYAVVGLIVADSENNVIYSTRNESSASQGLTTVKTKFKTNTSGLKAYLSLPSSSNTSVPINFVKKVSYLIKYDNLSINYKEPVLNKINTVSSSYAKYTTNINGRPDIDVNSSGYNIDVYKINKGITYNVKSANYWAIAGIIITDNLFSTKYKSSNVYVNNVTNINYNFTAEEDGYIFLSYKEDTWQPFITLETIQEKYYHNKKWSVIGDSLSDPLTLGVQNKNYVNYVSEDLGLIVENLGHGGSGYKARHGANQAFYQVASQLNNPDVITVFGSFNDTFDILSTYGWGTINDNTVNTICGSINVTLDNLITNYPNAVIGVIIPTPWRTRNSVDTSYSEDSQAKEKAETYVSYLKQICEKRSIPYLDLYTKSNLYPWNSNFNNSFFKDGDGTHPNSSGHLKITGAIKEFIKSILR